MLTVTRMLSTVTLLALAWAGSSSLAEAPAPHSHQDGATEAATAPAVLITGASSGIGRRTTELLAANGFFVYAGARKDKDLAELSAIENVQGIRLDVTVPAEIEAAVETVRAGGRGLYGLINNAGVVVLAPMLELTEEDLDFQLDVNVFGPYRVTKAFAPLLIESQGRVSVTGSISGFVTWELGGPYTMSKHAVEAFADVLALEMKALGVHVSVVEPGNYKSKISESMQKRMLEKGYTGEGSLYEGRMKNLLRGGMDRSAYEEPDDVAEAFLDFLTDDEPKLHYMVVPNRREAEMTLRAAMRRMVQLNQDQPYELDRDELVAMLDDVLAASKR